MSESTLWRALLPLEQHVNHGETMLTDMTSSESQTARSTLESKGSESSPVCKTAEAFALVDTDN